MKRWKTVLAALAIFCLLTGCGMMNHGDAESESPSPLEGPAATEGFTPAADSTWGDLFRHFDPEGFSKLPADVQSEFEYYDFMSDYRSPWVFNKILQKP